MDKIFRIAVIINFLIAGATWGIFLYWFKSAIINPLRVEANGDWKVIVFGILLFPSQVVLAKIEHSSVRANFLWARKMGKIIVYYFALSLVSFGILIGYYYLKACPRGDTNPNCMRSF